jgi:predicted PurR-regulated permease PerM
MFANAFPVMNILRFPVYFKLSQIIIGLLAFFYILYIGQSILIPLVFAALIGILLNPLVNRLHNAGLNRVIAIILTILLGMAVVTGILIFIGSQISLFRDALPDLERKFNEVAEQAIGWCSSKFHVSEKQIYNWIDLKKNETVDRAGGMVGGALVSISGLLVAVFLIPVYIFLFLFYKPLLLDFIAKLFSSDKHSTVAQVLFTTKTVIQSYLVGLLTEMVIVATLNSTVLLLVGVPYAVVLGVVGALLNLIPYIGGLIAISLPMLMAFITGTPIMVLWVFIGYICIQLLDNNIFVPMIVASKVRINALISIIVVLIGGAMWGVAGMFLSIPVTAICKVIFDKVKPLKPFGFLIGDTMPNIGKNIFRISAIQSAFDKKPDKKPEVPPSA